MGSSGIQGPKAGSRGFRGVYFPCKTRDPVQPTQAFIILKAANVRSGGHLSKILQAPWNRFRDIPAHSSPAFRPRWPPNSSKDPFVFLLPCHLMAEKRQNRSERGTRACLSQSGAGSLFHFSSGLSPRGASGRGPGPPHWGPRAPIGRLRGRRRGMFLKKHGRHLHASPTAVTRTASKAR